MTKPSRRFTVLLLAYLTLCVSAVYCVAAEEVERKWTSYMRERDRSVEYFFDKDAMVKTPQRMLNVWRKRVFAKGAAQKEIITFDNINCREAEFRSLQLTVINWDGTSKTFDKPSEWAHVFSSSPEEYLLEQYCNK
jgi:hypothetical protein